MRELGLNNLKVDWSGFKNIVYILQRYPSTIGFKISNGDALNGYGRSELYSVYIEVFSESCRHCHLSDWSSFVPVIKCNRHSWKREYQRLTICTSSIDFDEAMQRLNENLEIILREVEKT